MSNVTATRTQRWIAEFTGTAFLLATVVGSGVMGEQLAGGNVSLALLANSIATGAILYVLITILGPISGAHFNPAVTLGFLLRGEISLRESLGFVAAQISGAVSGVICAHLMFAMPAVLASTHVRSSGSLWFSEVVATFGLVLVIFGGVRFNPRVIPALVGLYITAAYWFTASTSFANPAVTIARALTESFSGIHYQSVPWFVLMQLLGAVLAVMLARVLFDQRRHASDIHEAQQQT